VSEARPKGLPAAIERYGSLRAYVLRSLYSWLTLTILFTFTWPLLVVYAGAPAESVVDTSGGWFQIRLLLALFTGAFSTWLWWVSPVPTEVGQPSSALALLRRGKVWPQVLVFLLGLALLLCVLLIIADPAKGLKVASYGLVEAVTVQVLLAGYMHGTFELVLEDSRAYLVTLGLFALTFAIRGGLASATQDDFGQDLLIVAAFAGAVVGLVAGGLSLFLRARSGSLLPGVLAYWLLFYILPAFFEA
jgi:hypothetical protein